MSLHSPGCCAEKKKGYPPPITQPSSPGPLPSPTHPPSIVVAHSTYCPLCLAQRRCGKMLCHQRPRAQTERWSLQHLRLIYYTVRKEKKEKTHKHYAARAKPAERKAGKKKSRRRMSRQEDGMEMGWMSGWGGDVSVDGDSGFSYI